MTQSRIKSIPNEILLQETAQLIRQGHTVTHTVRGNSMNPFLIDRRDKVVLAPFADSDLQRGAFVLGKDTTGKIVLHRIIKRESDVLTLMGDGNSLGTETVMVDQVAGLVTQIVRKGKTYSCKETVWKNYSSIWMRLSPLRRYLIGIWRRIHKIK